MKTQYDSNYHNNKFNFLISKLYDEKRTIMDFDTFISEGNKIAFLIDHKLEDPWDTISINTLKNLMNFNNIKLKNNCTLKCFIVRSNILLYNNDNDAKTSCYTTVYELIDYNNELMYKKSKELKGVDFIKHSYILRSDNELKEFFDAQTHEDFKLKILNRL
jgi:hypothetical protein